MSDIKQFILTKTSPSDVFFVISLISNPAVKREVYLTKQRPQQPLPAEYALSIVADPGLYTLYKKGYFTFNDNEGLAKLAYEQGYWFEPSFDFEPSSPKDVDLILSILKVGNRAKIEETIKKYGEDKVRDVAIANLSGLTQNVIMLLEKTFKVQLTMDNVADLGE